MQQERHRMPSSLQSRQHKHLLPHGSDHARRLHTSGVRPQIWWLLLLALPPLLLHLLLHPHQLLSTRRLLNRVGASGQLLLASMHLMLPQDSHLRVPRTSTCTCAARRLYMANTTQAGILMTSLMSSVCGSLTSGQTGTLHASLKGGVGWVLRGGGGTA